jgi:RimJ/RimL family protein N-acetyltransferase
MLQSVTTIEGERVLLRPPQEGDAEEASRVWTPELRYMYGGSRIAPQRPAVAAPAKADDNEHRFHIEADGRYIGHVGLRPNDEEQSGSYRIGIVNPEYWGRGYGTEVTRLMLRYAFETLGLHRVRLRVTAYNHRARRCYEQCGFRVEGIERESFLVDGEWQDDVLMGVLKQEWEAHVVRRTAGDHGDGEGEDDARERSVAAVRIRSYRAEDHPAVLALWEAAGLRRGASDEAEVVARKLRLERGPFLVAEAEGQIVGTVMGHVDRCWGWVNRLAVYPEWRRRGLARRLMAVAEGALGELGATSVHLLTHEENTAARALYQSLGYTTYRQIVYMNKDMGAESEGRGEH